MSKNEEPVEIIILNEEKAPKPEVSGVKKRVKDAAVNTGKRVGRAAQTTAQKAWESEARRRVTDKVGESASAAVTQSKEAIQESVKKAVNERIDLEKERLKNRLRETDWNAVAKRTLSSGFKLASLGLAKLSQRLAPKSEEPPQSSDSQ